MTYEDMLYEERDGVAHNTFNGLDKCNAFRGRAIEELIDAFQQAGWKRKIGVIVLTGAADRAVCTGGDQSARDEQYGGRGTVDLPVEELPGLIRDVRRHVVARGFASGGGNVLATLCDLTLASEVAVRAGGS